MVEEGEESGDVTSIVDSSQLQFTVLYGSHSNTAAHCYLLEVSGIKILLDCGWDSAFDPSLLEPLERVADKIDLVLISHANLEHIGALPYAYQKFKLKAKCLCTLPVSKLGHLVLYDAVLNGSAPYTLDQVDETISKCESIVYKQVSKVQVSSSGSNEMLLAITAGASGRTLGGTLWTIFQERYGVNILYASDMYQRREQLLDGFDPAVLPKNPTLLIQDCLGLAKPVNRPNFEYERDQELIKWILDCLRRGGDVLIPVDTSSRIFEILLLLNTEWEKNKLRKSYELIFLSRVSSMLDMIQTSVEWTSKHIQRQMEASLREGGGREVEDLLRFSQFSFKDSFEDAFPLIRNRVPRVVICGGVDMERSSFSREVFVREISHRQNCMVLLLFQSFIPTSLSFQLAAQAGTKGFNVQMEEEIWVELEGEELEQWKKRRELQTKELETERETEKELEAFEKSENTPENGLTTSATLTRQSSTLLERSSSLIAQDGSQTEKRSLKEIEKEELSFSFVPPDLGESWNEYGATFNINELLGDEESKVGASTNLTESKPQTAITTSTNILKEEKEDLGPKKQEKVTIQKSVNCEIRKLDYDGRMTRKDLFEIVGLIKPKKLVVVRSGLRESEAFATECQTKATCGVAVAPAPGECLDIGADSSVVRVRVPDETLQACPLAINVANFAVQRLKGRLAFFSMSGNNPDVDGIKRRRVAMVGGEMPSILSLRDGEDLGGDSAESWWVSKNNEPSLPHVMKLLKRAGINSVLSNGIILCGPAQNVTVWKPGDGRLLVGGPLCDLYFETRKVVYSCFALV